MASGLGLNETLRPYQARGVARIRFLTNHGFGALVFTQYAKVGTMLQRELLARFGKRFPFLHCGLSTATRETQIRLFNAGAHTVGTSFILSLKAAQLSFRYEQETLSGTHPAVRGGHPGAGVAHGVLRPQLASEAVDGDPGGDGPRRTSRPRQGAVRSKYVLRHSVPKPISRHATGRLSRRTDGSTVTKPTNPTSRTIPQVPATFAPTFVIDIKTIPAFFISPTNAAKVQTGTESRTLSASDKTGLTDFVISRPATGRATDEPTDSRHVLQTGDKQHAQEQIQQKQKQNVNLSRPQRWPVPAGFFPTRESGLSLKTSTPGLRRHAHSSSSSSRKLETSASVNPRSRT